MPDKATVLRWVNKDPEFQNKYAFAIEWRCDMLMDEILEIADGTYFDRHGIGGNQSEKARLAEARLQISVRKWLYNKLAPKKHRPSHKSPIVRLIIDGKLQTAENGDSLKSYATRDRVF